MRPWASCLGSCSEALHQWHALAPDKHKRPFQGLRGSCSWTVIGTVTSQVRSRCVGHLVECCKLNVQETRDSTFALASCSTTSQNQD